jgi:pilus assembly protein CpaB
MSRRAIALIVAVVLAAVATIALVSYVQSAHNKRVGTLVTAFVAKEDIPVGTDAATIISKGLIETRSVDKSVVPVGAIGSLQDIQAKVSIVPIYQNEIILAARFGTTVGSSPTGQLLTIPVGFQAMSVEVSTIPGVANFVQPGDKVSIIVQLTQPGSTVGALVKFVMQDIQVLQVGTRVIVPPANGQPGGSSVQQTAGKVDLTLAVTPVQAEKLALGTLQGTLYFTLVRPDSKPVNTPGRTGKTEFTR